MLNIEIFMLQTNNKDRTATKNSPLYFNAGDVSRICKWDSVTESPLGGLQFLYDVYQRLTIIPKLSDRATFAFRFSDDLSYLLQQYDLSVLYSSKDIDKIKGESNEIDRTKNINGDLVFYSENYQEKCKILFSYSEDEQSVIISLSNKKTEDYKGYKQIRIDKESQNIE